MGEALLRAAFEGAIMGWGLGRVLRKCPCSICCKIRDFIRWTADKAIGKEG